MRKIILISSALSLLGLAGCATDSKSDSSGDSGNLDSPRKTLSVTLEGANTHNLLRSSNHFVQININNLRFKPDHELCVVSGYQTEEPTWDNGEVCVKENEIYNSGTTATSGLSFKNSNDLILTYDNVTKALKGYYITSGSNDKIAFRYIKNHQNGFEWGEIDLSKALKPLRSPVQEMIIPDRNSNNRTINVTLKPNNGILYTKKYNSFFSLNGIKDGKYLIEDNAFLNKIEKGSLRASGYTVIEEIENPGDIIKPKKISRAVVSTTPTFVVDDNGIYSFKIKYNSPASFKSEQDGTLTVKYHTADPVLDESNIGYINYITEYTTETYKIKNPSKYNQIVNDVSAEYALLNDSNANEIDYKVIRVKDLDKVNFQGIINGHRDLVNYSTLGKDGNITFLGIKKEDYTGGSLSIKYSNHEFQDITKHVMSNVSPIWSISLQDIKLDTNFHRSFTISYNVNTKCFKEGTSARCINFSAPVSVKSLENLTNNKYFEYEVIENNYNSISYLVRAIKPTNRTYDLQATANGDVYNFTLNIDNTNKEIKDLYGINSESMYLSSISDYNIVVFNNIPVNTKISCREVAPSLVATPKKCIDDLYFDKTKIATENKLYIGFEVIREPVADPGMPSTGPIMVPTTKYELIFNDDYTETYPINFSPMNGNFSFKDRLVNFDNKNTTSSVYIDRKENVGRFLLYNFGLKNVKLLNPDKANAEFKFEKLGYTIEPVTTGSIGSPSTPNSSIIIEKVNDSGVYQLTGTFGAGSAIEIKDNSSAKNMVYRIPLVLTNIMP